MATQGFSIAHLQNVLLSFHAPQDYCLAGEFPSRSPVYTDRNGLSAYTSFLAMKGLEVSFPEMTVIRGMH